MRYFTFILIIVIFFSCSNQSSINNIDLVLLTDKNKNIRIESYPERYEQFESEIDAYEFVDAEADIYILKRDIVKKYFDKKILDEEVDVYDHRNQVLGRAAYEKTIENRICMDCPSFSHIYKLTNINSVKDNAWSFDKTVNNIPIYISRKKPKNNITIKRYYDPQVDSELIYEHARGFDDIQTFHYMYSNQNLINYYSILTLQDVDLNVLKSFIFKKEGSKKFELLYSENIHINFVVPTPFFSNGEPIFVGEASDGYYREDYLWTID
tara:strand:- start:61 stop:861 length:801 start_codon:yes stop_codon:yes gene_type:complete